MTARRTVRPLAILTMKSMKDMKKAYAALHVLHGKFIRVPYDLFKFTTADENDTLGGSVGADLRAATSLGAEVAAQERCSHIKTGFS